MSNGQGFAKQQQVLYTPLSFFETLSMFHKIEINPSSPPSFQLPAECLMAKIAAVFYDKDQQLLMSWIKICSLFYIKQYVAIRLSSENL